MQTNCWADDVEVDGPTSESRRLAPFLPRTTRESGGVRIIHEWLFCRFWNARPSELEYICQELRKMAALHLRRLEHADRPTSATENLAGVSASVEPGRRLREPRS